MKTGFTLIEMLVIIGVFGVLLVAGSIFIVQMLSNINRTRVESEVRQNASEIFQAIQASIRSAACVKWESQPDHDYDATDSTPGDFFLRTYSDSCVSLIDEYQFVVDRTPRQGDDGKTILNSGKVLRNHFGSGFRQISANSVAALNYSCGTACNNGDCTAGLVVPTGGGVSGTNQPVTIQLAMQATTSAVRVADFCAVTKLSVTVAPRMQY